MISTIKPKKVRLASYYSIIESIKSINSSFHQLDIGAWWKVSLRLDDFKGFFQPKPFRDSVIALDLLLQLEEKCGQPNLLLLRFCVLYVIKIAHPEMCILKVLCILIQRKKFTSVVIMLLKNQSSDGF